MDNSLAGYHFFFGTFAFVLGAVVGSFLNVCIYRMPLDLSVNEPRRSFCPACKKQLKWHQNIPLLSWLFLRGRCANCGSRIAFRYFVVELVTALLFLAVWLQFPWPDRARVLGFRFAAHRWNLHRLRALHHSGRSHDWRNNRRHSRELSCARPHVDGRKMDGALNLGAFGAPWLRDSVDRPRSGQKGFRKKENPAGCAHAVYLDAKGRRRRFRRGRRTGFVERLFFARNRSSYFALRRSGRGHSQRRENGSPISLQPGKDRRRRNFSRYAGANIRRGARTSDSARSDGTRRFEIPRGHRRIPGMARGFVQRFAGSLLGSLVGLATLLIGRRVWSAKLPFGPYLAFGGLVWMFFGESLLSWYMGLLNP